MKIEAPINENYAARVVEVKNLRKADNSDNLQVIPSLGMQAIVDLQTMEGEIGLLIPAGSRLSDEFLQYNNLYRHAEKNKDTSKVGYIEDDRRLKAITLRGNRSDALFLPMNCVKFCFSNINEFNEFILAAVKSIDSNTLLAFDTLNGVRFMEKYEKPVRLVRGAMAGGREGARQRSKIDEKFFPQQGHVTNYFYVDRNIPADSFVTITQKLHGTNIRIGHVPVEVRKQSWWQRVLRRKASVTTEWRMVYGSHHVVKDANNPDQQHFYDEDLWTQRGHELDGLLPKGFVVYGELVGYTKSGSPIQSHYTYDCPKGTNKMFVYRVTQVSPDGIAVDLSWDAVKEFCKELGLNAVPELYRGKLDDVDINGFLDIDFAKTVEENLSKFGKTNTVDMPVPLSPDSPCDEGVVIRIEGIHPQIYKAKSPKFVQHESKMYEDPTAVDMEAEEESQSQEAE